MKSTERVKTLIAAGGAYADSVSTAYDEVIVQIAERAADAGSLGKLDVGALLAWKRLRCDTRWMAELMGTPDVEVRRHTSQAVLAARDESRTVPEAAAAARSALTPLPGFPAATLWPRRCASPRLRGGSRSMTREPTVGLAGCP